MHRANGTELTLKNVQPVDKGEYACQVLKTDYDCGGGGDRSDDDYDCDGDDDRNDDDDGDGNHDGAKKRTKKR